MKKTRGCTLLEVVVASSFLAVASLGLGGAMVSGATLENRASRTMSEVATAENLMEQIRHQSWTKFTGVVSDYSGMTTASNAATGYVTDDQRTVQVVIPLKESEVPGGVDLNSNGELDEGNVKAADADILVVDILGENSFLLRTAVFNLSRLKGVMLERDDSEMTPVGYGETREAPVIPEDPEADPEEDQKEQTQSSVTVIAAALNGNDAGLVFDNQSGDSRKVTSVTVGPDKDTMYFEQILLENTPLYLPDEGQEPGTVTVIVSSELSLAPGENQFVIQGFWEYDQNGSPTNADPKSVVVTVTFDDGSVTTATVVPEGN